MVATHEHMQERFGALAAVVAIIAAGIEGVLLINVCPINGGKPFNWYRQDRRSGSVSKGIETLV